MDISKLRTPLITLAFSTSVFAAIEGYRTGGNTLPNLIPSGLGSAVVAATVAAAFALLKKLILPEGHFKSSFVRFFVVATLIFGFSNYTAANYERSQEFKDEM